MLQIINKANEQIAKHIVDRRYAIEIMFNRVLSTMNLKHKIMEANNGEEALTI
jgi:hypothetical protein